MKSDDIKSKIKTAAIRLFAQNGYLGTSVREISHLAEVNVAAINYHFGGKEGLLREFFKDYSKDRLWYLISLLDSASSVEEFRVKLGLFAKQFIEGALIDSEKVEMIYRNLELFAENYSDLFADSFVKLHNSLVVFIASAQNNQIVRNDIQAKDMGQIFMSSLADVVRHRSFRMTLLGFSIEDPETKDRYIQSLINCFIDGAKHNDN